MRSKDSIRVTRLETTILLACGGLLGGTLYLAHFEQLAIRALAKEWGLSTRAGVSGVAVSLLTTKNATVATAKTDAIVHQSRKLSEIWCRTVYLSSIIRSKISR